MMQKVSTNDSTQRKEQVMQITTEGGLIIEVGKLGSALWSPDKRHRYRLTRPMDDVNGPRVLVVMQNPSKAGPDDDDPTITRVCGLARRLSPSTITVVNLGAGVATDPKDFLKLSDPLGEMNRAILRESALGMDIAVAAWGALSSKLRKLFRINLGIVKQFNHMRCWGKTKHGDPRHPLYLRQDTPLIEFAD